jgi:drug/metabolite transporter (DMT)-like permease
VWLLVLINISAVIVNPIVVAYAMDPLLVTFWRCFFGAVILAPTALIVQPRFFRNLNLSQWGWLSVAGVTLAVHFVTLMEGLHLVNLGVAITIMSTGTIFTGLLGIVILKRFLVFGQWVGLVTGLGGIVLYAYLDDSLQTNSSAGVVSLLVSAVSFAIYVVTGQKLRRDMSNFVYVAVVFSVATVVSFGFALATSRPVWVEQSSDWVGIALIAFFGQIMVQTLSNLYLKNGEAAFLQLTALVQIPLLAIIGWVAFDQRTGIEILPSLFLVVLGIIIYVVSQPKRIV